MFVCTRMELISYVLMPLTPLYTCYDCIDSITQNCAFLYVTTWADVLNYINIESQFLTIF